MSDTYPPQPHAEPQPPVEMAAQHPAPVAAAAPAAETESKGLGHSHQSNVAAPAAHQRKGIDWIMVGLLALLILFDFITFVITAVFVTRANDGYGFDSFVNWSQTKYLLAVTVLCFPAIVYFGLLALGVTVATDRQRIAPLTAAAVMVVMFIIGGALEAHFVAHPSGCIYDYYGDFDCVYLLDSTRGSLGAAAAFAFFCFAIWAALAALTAMRSFGGRRSATNPSTV